MNGLLRAAWDRKFVREWCDLAYLPSLLESMEEDKDGKVSVSVVKDGYGHDKLRVKPTQKYVEAKKKADKAFEEIMASPEKIQQTVDGYSLFLKEQRIAQLEAELDNLKGDA